MLNTVNRRAPSPALRPEPPPTVPGPLAELRNVSKRFGSLVVLNGVSLQVFPGQSLVIIGASGSGKSVMLKHMTGLLTPDSGEVFYASQRIDNMKESKLNEIRKRFGFLFQMGALFDSDTVYSNIAFPLHEHTRKPEDEIRQIVAEKLALVGLSGIEKKLPGQLSGGQKKRVALARAIALNPEIIFYDEPTTGLDPIRSDVINQLIVKLQSALKVTSVVVTHDMTSAFKIANRIVMLHKGKLIVDGSPEEIQNSDDPLVRRFVTGEADEQELAAVNATTK